MPRPAAQVIFATHRAPWPLDNGARIRTARLAQGLARALDLTLVTFAGGPAWDPPVASRGELEALLPEARIELVPFRAPRLAARAAVGATASAAWGTYATPELRAALARAATDRPGALLHLDSPAAGLAGLGLAPGRTIYAAHNIEHRVWRDVAARRPAAQRGYLEVEWRKIEQEERRCWRSADLCLAVSELDAAVMRAGGAHRVEVCPNGADARDPLSPAPRDAGDPARLLFVGFAGYWPYEHGLAWLATEVMPRARAILDVVGEPPRDPVAAPGVAYHGRVSDVTPFYAAADALVVPMFEGSGTRLKVIEAAFLGRPIISTAVGVEGLPLRPAEHYLHAENAPQWARAIERVRSDPAGMAAMAARARAALARLQWPLITAELSGTYRRLASGG
ncbi:MAG: glycosyltransferase family 4 protein [Solirubrobacteraceae bacterium]